MGFTLIELTVVASITTLLTVLGARYVAQQALETTAVATGAYLDTVRGALDNYLSANFLALSNNTPVAGYAAQLAPTVAELRADGRLQGGFPLFTPIGPQVNIQIVRTACPGAGCRLDAVVNLTAPILDSAGEPRYDIADVARAATRGGLASSFIDQGNLTGVTGTFVNPLGVQGGVVGVTTTLDTTTFNSFVRTNDTRLTNLNEALTVNAGPLATAGVALNVNGNQVNTGNLTVGGTMTVAGATTFTGGLTSVGDFNVQNGGGVNCVTLSQTGVVTIGCAGTLNANTGVFTDGGGNTTTISPTGVTATGRVTANAGLATATATLFDAANPDRITVTGNQSFIFGAGGQMVAFDNGDVAAARNIAGQRLSLTVPVVLGSACANNSGAFATGVEYASTATGGLAVCRPGVGWVGLQEVAAQGSVCTTGDGTVAVDATTGVGLICRGGRWTQTMSLLSSFVLIRTDSVTNDQVIPKPVCTPNGGAFAGVPLLLLQAGNEGITDDYTLNRYALDLGAAGWQIKITDSVGTPLGGSRAIAMGYCLYAP